ncbi:MAG: dihydrofolate reductase, partial [Clostridia bacterium]|nr:dihydrofolate reductase [Clostridia bacterium]
PLKNRVNIVLTRGQVCDECVIVRSYEELFEEMKARKNEQIFVIGGGEIYKALLPYCHGAYVTKVDAIGGAEVFFPNLDEHPDFVCVEESAPMDDNGLTIRFTKYENKNVKEL